MKSTENGITTSHLKELNEAERVAEIARMAGGTVITEATLKAAQEMIDAVHR